MMRKSDIDRIKVYIKKDKFMIQQYNELKKKADKIINEQPVKYVLADGVRLLSVSRVVSERLQVLGLIYNITSEEKYAERAWKELETICDMNPDRKSFAFPD